MKKALIVPVWNEAGAIGRVLKEVPVDLFDDVIVVDGGSTDDTVTVARLAGARVVVQEGRGYGAACLTGVHATDADIVVFLDGDYSDPPAQAKKVLAPLLDGRATLVLGSRELGRRQPGALPLHARVGNLLAVGLLRLLYGVRVTDLPSYKAIGRADLLALNIRDLHYGWTAEIIARTAHRKLAIVEVPIDYRARIGASKVSGTVKGSIKAGCAILRAVVGVRFQNRDLPHRPRISTGTTDAN